MSHELPDNIAEPSVEDVTDLMERMKSPPESKPQESATQTLPAQKPQVILFDLVQANAAICQNYGRTIRKLMFKPPQHAIDGSVVEFYDGDLGVVLATARLRIRSELHFTEKGGLFIEALLSDLSFGHKQIHLDIRK